MASRRQIRERACPQQMPPPRLRLTLRAAIVFSLLCLLFPFSAFSDPPTEYQVEAAYLLNFTKFVEWPSAAFADGGSPFTVCVLGDDPFGGGLDQMVQGEAVARRRVVVQRLRRAPDRKNCQMLYVGRTGRDVSEMLAALGPGVLTVGEGDQFVQQGGMIGFVLENRRVRFDVNQAAAVNAGLTLSSRLLNVARVVRNKIQDTRP